MRTERKETTNNGLAEMRQDGAQQMPALAIDVKVAADIEEHQNEQDGCGYRRLVFDGSMPNRRIESSVGQIQIHQLRSNDRCTNEVGKRMRYQSKMPKKPALPGEGGAPGDVHGEDAAKALDLFEERSERSTRRRWRAS